MMRGLSDEDLDFPVSEDFGEATSNELVSLDARRGKPAWQKEIVDALCKLLELRQGWDSYDGKSLRHDTGMFALQVLNSIMNESIPMPSIVPVSSGGVQIEWHQNGLDIELYIAAPYDCELSVRDHHNNGSQETMGLSSDFGLLDQWVRRLVDFNRHLYSQTHAV